MYKNMRISAILPCRNEGSHLAEVVTRIPKIVDEIIIVSNKSTDNTVEVAKALGVRVYEDNRAIKGIGYGYAHMTGIEHANGDLIVAIDGDATYPIEDLPLIIDSMIERNLDFVSCNRYPLKKGTKISPKLQLGVQILNIETLLLYGKRINDILSGMWVFKSSIKDDLNLTMGDWNLSPQIKINAFTSKSIKAGEHSISQHLREGETKQDYFKTGLSHLLWILSNRFGLGSPKQQYVLKFAVVGFSSFIVNSLLLLLFVHVLNFDELLSEIVAMALTLQMSFILHDRWTYISAVDDDHQYAKSISARYLSYIGSNLIGAMITVLVYGLLIASIPPIAALAIGSAITMIWNFILNRLVVWRH